MIIKDKNSTVKIDGLYKVHKPIRQIDHKTNEFEWEIQISMKNNSWLELLYSTEEEASKVYDDLVNEMINGNV